MLTIRTIPDRTRKLVFSLAASTDLILRVATADWSASSLLLGASSPESVDLMSIGEMSGVMVPVIAAPLILSPIAYLVGQLVVVLEANYVRAVSAFFIVASFVVYTTNPWMSALGALLAYLILASGMLPSSNR